MDTPRELATPWYAPLLERWRLQALQLDDAARGAAGYRVGPTQSSMLTPSRVRKYWSFDAHYESVGGKSVCEAIGFRACVMSVRMTRLAVSLGALTACRRAKDSENGKKRDFAHFYRPVIRPLCTV